MMRTLLITAGLTLGCTAASAQLALPSGASFSPYPTRISPTQFAPNFFNRQSQPLSPYLNLTRGVDPVTNYYYGVRPALQSGAGGVVQQFNTMPVASPARVGFLPAAANPSQEPTIMPTAGVKVDAFPPASHPVTYGAGTGRPRLTGGVAMNNPSAANRPGATTPPPAYARKATRGTSPSKK